MADNGKIKIDKGVPMPPARRRGVFPWAEMKVGDSFLVPTNGSKPEYRRAQALSDGRNWAQRNAKPWKFTSSVTPKGARIWRIE